MMSMDILGLCDRLLGEVGRRQHRFAWLLDPGAGPGEWLPVDAYYPGRRLVVVLDAEGPEAQLCTELMPQHGLRLLALSAGELGPDRAAAEPALRGMLEALKLPERRTAEADSPPRAPVRLEEAFARLAASFAHVAAPAPPARPSRPSQAAAAQRAARVVAARVPSSAASRAAAPGASRLPTPRRPRPVRREPRPIQPRRSLSRPSPRTASPALGASEIGLGVLLCAIVAVELYVGVARLGVHAGLWGLALGLSIDACARVLGTVAARRAGAPHAAWTCAIAGSPGVAMFTLFAPDGAISVDPAPLAGVLSVLATLLTGASLIALLL
jgi:hypothetical protein